MTAEIISLQRAAIWIQRDEDGWLVIAGDHGWLHGDRVAAMKDARWLSRNLARPIREAA